MKKSLIENIVVVTRKTELEELVARFNTVSQARFYIEHANQSFGPIEAAHQCQQHALSEVRSAIGRGQKSQVMDRTLVPQFHFDKDDLVIAVGQDGLVSNTAKYLQGQPIMGVNPDPRRFDGVLLPFDASSIGRGLAECRAATAKMAKVSLAEVTLTDGQRMLAFNDFFIGAVSHVSARYDLTVNGATESHSSSGIIVSTGAGSTGWLKSVYAGARGVVEALGGKVSLPRDQICLPWNTRKLLYSVREPFPSISTGVSLVHGAFSNASPLVVVSHMGANGVIFSDGVEADYLEFNSGTSATVTIADKVARLVQAS